MRLFSFIILFSALLLPTMVQAQIDPGEIRSLHDVLDGLMAEMLPMCEDLVDASRIIAGFAAIFYIGFRVWRHIAAAEPVDFFPLVRPFVLAFCIGIFPQIIWLINGVLSPTEAATRQMVDDTNAGIEALMAQRQKELQNTKQFKMYGVNEGEGDRDVWMEYTYPDEIGDEGIFGGIGNDMEFAMSKAYYNLKNWFKDFVSFLLQLLYEAAALCINTLRTFNLLILALLGPFVLALSVFDGLHHTLVVWLARYINFYLWLPIANLLGAMLGKIQEGMIQLDLSQIKQYGETFYTTSDIGYLVFMIIGIIAYTTVPGIAHLAVNTGGGLALTDKVSNMAFGSANSFGNSVAGGAGMGADALGDAHNRMSSGFGGYGSSSGYFNDKLKG